jgi:dTDP-4-dehydrorhamnose reductase
MRFLIIGASGFIGQHILDYTRAMGYETLGTQCNSGKPGLVLFDLLKNRLEESVNPGFFKTRQKVFVVICAALSQIDRCLLEKDISYKINVKNTIRLIEDIKKYGAFPVFISTSAVYDGHLGYYNEDSPHAPICEYGRHKDEVEKFLQNEMPDAFILRLDKIVADSPFGNHLFSDWYKQIQNNQPIICIDQLFSPTSARDVAKAITKGCQLGLSGAYNVANPEFFTRVELASQFVAAVGEETEIILKRQEEFNFADPRLTKSYLDSTRFISDTGMRFTSMREIFNSFLLQRITIGEQKGI